MEQCYSNHGSHSVHEFNNYLTPAMVYAELLENVPETGERGKKMAGEMHFLSRLQKDPKCCDIIVASYTLDTMNGIEFLEIARKLNPDICLVLASESDDADLQWYVKNKIIDRIIMKDKLLSELDTEIGLGRKEAVMEAD
ncbi:MAG: response regulator transcription factor [Oribacterium sp.]|nr:response regulator transcription factor [Oribacterium sp.]